MSHTNCTPLEIQQRRTAGTVHLLDVRTPAEFRALHADGATLILNTAIAPCQVF